MSPELAAFFLLALCAAEVALWVRDWFRDAIAEPFMDLVLTP